MKLMKLTQLKHLNELINLRDLIELSIMMISEVSDHIYYCHLLMRISDVCNPRCVLVKHRLAFCWLWNSIIHILVSKPHEASARMEYDLRTQTVGRNKDQVPPESKHELEWSLVWNSDATEVI